MKEAIERFEHECGLVRVQAVNQGEAMLDRVEAALGVADRHLGRVRTGVLPLSPAVTREIEASIDRARAIVGVGPNPDSLSGGCHRRGPR